MMSTFFVLFYIVLFDHVKMDEIDGIYNYSSKKYSTYKIFDSLILMGIKI